MSIKKEYIFYGAIQGSMRKERAEKYVEQNHGNLLFYCDTNPNNWNDERKIYSPDKIKDYPEAVVVVLCFAVNEVVPFLRNKGIKNEILAYPNLAFGFFEELEMLEKESRKWIDNNKNRLYELYDCNDAETERTLRISAEQRRMERFTFVEATESCSLHPLQYLGDKSISPEGRITFVDCGACIGGSILSVFHRYKKDLAEIYAIEPDKDNFKKLRENLMAHPWSGGVHFYQCGVAEEEKILFFSENQDKSSRIVSSGEVKIQVRPLDNLVTHVTGSLCIAMDIEGAEVSAIKGAARIIQEYRPYMNICLYHQMADILDVPEAISNICPDYKFYLRSGLHTECYAVPQKL